MTQEGQRHVQFKLATQSTKKEAAALSDASLMALGRELPTFGTKLCMYLNVPTVTIINLRERAKQKATDDFRATVDGLLYWKQMRSNAREKEKVAELEKALRELGQPEIAEILVDKNRDNAELTADCFTH